LFRRAERALRRGFEGSARSVERAVQHCRKACGGFTHAAFCAVVRPEDHPLRPKDYVPLDAFWQKRGYAKADGLVTRFAWKDIDRSGETEKPMQFWMRAL